MDAPLSIWYCDHCGEAIESSKKGYVIWKSTDIIHHDFRIIHQAKCDSKEFNLSMPLDTFIGTNGLEYMLTFLSRGIIKINIGDSSRCQIYNFDEYVDFFRRVQTPYYEEARKYFREQNVLEYFSDSNEFNPYTTEALKFIIQMNHAKL